MAEGKLNFKRIERVVKGFANHRRVQIMELLKRQPELTLEQICGQLGTSYENTSDHVRKLAIGGLVIKRNQGALVRHKLSPRGEMILVFCRKLF